MRYSMTNQLARWSKQARWLLLQSRKSQEGQAVQLQELLETNKPLATAYVSGCPEGNLVRPSIREGWLRWRAWMAKPGKCGKFAKHQHLPLPVG